jgi:hydrogen cyanide synthase HcnC
VGFDVSTTAAAARTLSEGAIRAIPGLEDVAVKRVWSGLRPGSPDELPILGPVDGLAGYLNACGHFRTGVVNAPLTGLMLAEIAAGERPSYPVEPFLLSRFDTSETVPGGSASAVSAAAVPVPAAPAPASRDALVS